MAMEVRLVRACATFTRPQKPGYLLPSPATGWRWVNAGLLPPPVKLGANSTAFVKRELDAVMAARVAGADDEAIKRLVADLVARRADLVKGV